MLSTALTRRTWKESAQRNGQDSILLPDPLLFHYSLLSSKNLDIVSFIVKILMRVEQELRPFIILFGCTIFVDSLVFMTLGFNLTDIQDETYSGVQQLWYSLFKLRTSIGDFIVDLFSELPMASRILMCFLWVSIIFMNTIILLNFLIAVINDVYEQVMETRTRKQCSSARSNMCLETQTVTYLRSISQALAKLITPIPLGAAS